jgi:hypothetical protein
MVIAIANGNGTRRPNDSTRSIQALLLLCKIQKNTAACNPPNKNENPKSTRTTVILFSRASVTTRPVRFRHFLRAKNGGWFSCENDKQQKRDARH